jgi:hypothetical protein
VGRRRATRTTLTEDGDLGLEIGTVAFRREAILDGAGVHERALESQVREITN